MNFYQRYKRKRAINKSKKYLRSVQTAVHKNAKRARMQGGRETTPLYKRWLLNEDMPLRRAPHREKHILETLKYLRDINPDASMAVWNFLRLANQGHTVEVFDQNGDNDGAAQEYINSDLAQRVGKLYSGGTDQLINVLNLTGYTEGAVALEVELNESLDDVVDFHVISPSRLDFIMDKETEELVLVERKIDGTFTRLNMEQVFYVPIDPDVDDPYGRSPMLPAIEAILFQTEVLRDLKAVAHHQGHARFDISVSAEAILKNLPQHVLDQGDEAVQEFVDSYMDGVFSQFEELEADDDFLHDDSAKVQTVGGTNGKSMDSKSLIEIINQQVVTSLKQLPILLGRNESTTETHGSIQWEIHVAGVKSIQNVTKRLLEKAYTVALRVQGNQSTVKITFNDVRTKDRAQEANAEAIEINNEILKVQQGWIDNDEASNVITGHDAVGEPKQPQQSDALGSYQAFLQSKAKSKEDDDLEGDETGRYIRKFPSKALLGKRGRRGEQVNDEEIFQLFDQVLDASMDIAYGEFLDVLKSQLDNYIKNINKAPEPPKLERRQVIKHTRDDEEEETDDELELWLMTYVFFEMNRDVEMWRGVVESWLTQVTSVIGNVNLLNVFVDVQFNQTDERLMEWINWRAENTAIQIVDTNRKEVLKVINEVLSEGPYSVKDVAKKLENSYMFDKWRAETIARTELLSAGSTGQFASDLQLYDLGIVIGKEWRSAHQDRTRQWHKDANGQKVGFMEFFIVNGEKLMFPRDSENGASADNVISCRCWYKTLFAEVDE
ncbi:phage minor head protein [Vagococcus fluvialis]|uniref:phage minor head protein n=1 Tax=Vagococcus fluvialis TaxID=2738 RepID=UPI001D0BDC77|nr:phage minor head protein [Vagococcus fluvialis]UDM72403.1 phage head morphogenesis protein [Vagococcus fluvialis]UDM77268.1 phage head morphogenesis protein [Vagococcus fluvialis]UDM81538.1 phage head morphogenesis protein [Vagococcus fluvialis]